MALAEHQLAKRYRESGISSFCNPLGQVPDLPSTEPVAPKTASSFCEKTSDVPVLVRRIFGPEKRDSGPRRLG
jgi:hypothetical protein